MSSQEAYLFAASCAFSLLSLRLGIPLLRRWKIGQEVRDDGPPSHLAKRGTPTMGGLGILLAVSAVFLPFVLTAPNELVAQYYQPALLAYLAFVGFGVIGLLDDCLSVSRARPLGLKARYKLPAEILLAAALAWAIIATEQEGALPSLESAFGWIYWTIAVVGIAGTANALNVTDGLDGLAAGVAITSGLFLWAITSVDATTADLSPNGLDLFTASLVGATLGFLWHNRYPAKVFMGDTGSLALGAGVAALAVSKGLMWLLPLFVLVPLLELLSVVLQVVYFRRTGGKRILRMAPLHHHMELSGWPEMRVTLFLWAVNCAGGLAGWAIAGIWR